LPLNTVTLENIDNYTVDGGCVPELGSVAINLPNLSAFVECSVSGRYTASLNLTNLTADDVANLSVQQGELEYWLAQNDVPNVDLDSITEAFFIQNQPIARSYEHLIKLHCSETGEKIYFSGVGLEPTVQIHECSSSALEEEVLLTLAMSTETNETNAISVTSTDLNGNPIQHQTNFNLPIDNKRPTIAIISNGDIVQGQVATFVVNVEDKNLDFSTLDFLPTSGWVSSPACESFPCLVEVSGASEGYLKLFVEQGKVLDIAGNSNIEEVISEIYVNAAEFNFASAE
jgi:hypothetical protein